MILVDFVGDVGFERDGRELRCARKSHLDGYRAVLFQERQLMSGERPGLAQLLGYNAGHARYRSGFLFPSFPLSRHRIAHIEAFHRVGKITHEIAPAQFAIGGKRKAQLFLFAEDALYVQILKPAQLLSIERRIVPGFEQFRGPQKASHVVGMKFG